MEKVKKIDIHAHATAFPQYHPKVVQDFVCAEDVIEVYDKLGVEKGILLPLTSAEGMVTPFPTEACIYICDQYPDRFDWFCNVDPRARNNTPESDLSALMKEYKEMGAKGVGEITAMLYADDPKMENLFRSCAENDMPVIIHIAPNFNRGYGIVDEIGLPRITKILKKYPNLKLIGHSMSFWSEIDKNNNDEIRNKYPEGKVTEGRLCEMLREFPNLYCDLSAGSGANALLRDKDFAIKFMEEFSDRIMYGIDLCMNPKKIEPTKQYKLAEFFDEILEDGLLSEETYRKIMRENAIRILKL